MQALRSRWGRPIAATILLLGTLLLAACAAPAPQLAGPAEIVFFNWENDLPDSIIQSFEKDTGIHLRVEPYKSQEELLQRLRAGETFDVINVENQLIPLLVKEGRAAKLDAANIPNVANLSPLFLRLPFDPKNEYSLPNSWGTTGVLVRTDRTDATVTRWSDLFDSDFRGKLAVRLQKRDLIGIALLSVGYSVNSEVPGQLEEALYQLLKLKPGLTVAPDDPEAAIEAMDKGQAAIMEGWAADLIPAQKKFGQVTYVIPADATLVWGESYVIDQHARNKKAAETFLNYMLRPEISARYINETGYATATQAAWPLVGEQIRSNRAIFPPEQDLKKMMEVAEFILPLSSSGEALYDDIWQRFLAAQ